MHSGRLLSGHLLNASNLFTVEARILGPIFSSSCLYFTQDLMQLFTPYIYIIEFIFGMRYDYRRLFAM